MKLSSSSLLAVFATASLISSAHGSSYTNDFNTLISGQDMNGWQGWSVNEMGTVNTDSVVNVAAGVSIGSAPWGAGTASIGYTTPTYDKVYVNHGTSTPLIGGGVNASFNVTYQVLDSFLAGAPDSNRDTFGFRLQNAAGANLFSFHLNPFDQDANPSADTEFNTYSWSSAFYNGGSPTLVLPGKSSEEGFAYTFKVDFSASGANDIAFTATLQGIDPFSGVLTGASTQTISNFGAFMDTLAGPTNNGTNRLLFDNINLVPEPSAALLGALGTLALLRRRRL